MAVNIIKHLKLTAISAIFFTNLVVADNNCKNDEPFKYLINEIVVEDIKFDFVRLAELNDNGDWQDPSCYYSQLFILDKQQSFVTEDIPLMESTAILVETMKSKKFNLAVTITDKANYVLIKGNGGGSQSAFFLLYALTEGNLSKLDESSYARGEITIYEKKDKLFVEFEQFDYESENATCSACTPIIKATKSYLIQ